MAKNELMPTLSWQNRAKGLASNFISFVFPPRCAICNTVGSLVCADCYGRIQWIEEPICLLCGRVLSEPQSQCRVCEKRPLPTKQIRAATLFADPISKIIHKFKYNGQFGLDAPLANLMITSWPEWETAVDLIVPIPLHSQRERKRGYNQSTLLAKKFGKHLDIPVREHCLQRIKNTTPQVNLNAVDRQDNMHQAFVVNETNINDQDILLIDDVCTTGATMASAAEALIHAGARTVSGYCVARAM